jgi:hypothetical protein
VCAMVDIFLLMGDNQAMLQQRTDDLRAWKSATVVSVCVGPDEPLCPSLASRCAMFPILFENPTRRNVS